MKPEEMNITFGEFVNFVVRVKDNGMFCNEHWETYYKLCHLSAIHYDFSGRFENLETEARYVLEISGLIKNVSFPKVKLSDTSSKIPFSYSQLPNETLNSIMRIFRGHSEMFGYDFPDSIV